MDNTVTQFLQFELISVFCWIPPPLKNAYMGLTCRDICVSRCKCPPHFSTGLFLSVLFHQCNAPKIFLRHIPVILRWCGGKINENPNNSLFGAKPTNRRPGYAERPCFCALIGWGCGSHSRYNVRPLSWSSVLLQLVQLNIKPSSCSRLILQVDTTTS